MRAVCAILFLLYLLAAAAYSEILTREEALKTAFPGAEIRTSMLFLTDSQIQEAQKLSGVKVETKLVARYDAIKGGISQGRAYLDTHIVRTKKESLMVILDSTGKAKRVEVVAFQEPPEYMPSGRWYEQFQGKSLTSGLQLRKEIHPVTGATLTAQATTEAVRRILAIDRLLQTSAAKEGER